MTLVMLRSTYRLSSASAGPPQIMSVHFHARVRATSCWLRHEIRKVLSFSPFLSTTGGCGSNSFEVPPSLDEVEAGSLTTSTPDADSQGRPATDQAAGLVIPALTSAAAIFCCCVMSELFIGALWDGRRTTSCKASVPMAPGSARTGMLSSPPIVLNPLGVSESENLPTLSEPISSVSRIG